MCTKDGNVIGSDLGKVGMIIDRIDGSLEIGIITMQDAI